MTKEDIQKIADGDERVSKVLSITYDCLPGVILTNRQRLLLSQEIVIKCLNLSSGEINETGT